MKKYLIGVSLAVGLAGCVSQHPATDACLGLQLILTTADAVLAANNSPNIAHLKSDVVLATAMVQAGCSDPAALDAMIAALQKDLTPPPKG